MYLGSPMGVSVYLNTRCSNFLTKASPTKVTMKKSIFCVHLPQFNAVYGVLLYGGAINIFFSLLSKYFWQSSAKSLRVDTTIKLCKC